MRPARNARCAHEARSAEALSERNMDAELADKAVRAPSTGSWVATRLRFSLDVSRCYRRTPHSQQGNAVNSLDYPGPAWSPYVVGAGIGVLSWLTFYFSDKPIGASSFYAQVSGFIGKLFAKRHTESLAYFKDKPPQVGWGFVFVLSIIVGGAIAADGRRVRQRMACRPCGLARFGDSIALRAGVAFGGGLLMAFGARLAGGCTSGHGISGTMQLNVASWIAVICFFIGGIAVAMTLFKL
jgi:uncharacterized protein